MDPAIGKHTSICSPSGATAERPIFNKPSSVRYESTDNPRSLE